MKAQLAVSKVYTALAGSKEQSSGIASQVQNSTQAQGQDSPQIPCTWSSVLYTALRNRGKKKEKWTQKTRNEQTKNLPLSSHAFLKCSPRQSPESGCSQSTQWFMSLHNHTWPGREALPWPSLYLCTGFSMPLPDDLQEELVSHPCYKGAKVSAFSPMLAFMSHTETSDTGDICPKHVLTYQDTDVLPL